MVALSDSERPDAKAPNAPRAKKKPPQRGRRRQRASPPDKAAPPVEPAPPASREETPRSRRWVWPLLLGLGLFELWLFGRRGHLDVCVAQEGVHDFALLGQDRTDENTRRYPTCEKRLNLGITSKYDEAVQEAMLRACHRANVLRGREATLLCAIQEDGWQHRVTETHCPPWHDHYRQRLFWFLE